MKEFNTRKPPNKNKKKEYCCKKCVDLGFNFEKLEFTPWQKDCKYCNNKFKNNNKINTYGGIRLGKEEAL